MLAASPTSPGVGIGGAGCAPSSEEPADHFHVLDDGGVRVGPCLPRPVDAERLPIVGGALLGVDPDEREKERVETFGDQCRVLGYPAPLVEPLTAGGFGFDLERVEEGVVVLGESGELGGVDSGSGGEPGEPASRGVGDSPVGSTCVFPIVTRSSSLSSSSSHTSNDLFSPCRARSTTHTIRQNAAELISPSASPDDASHDLRNSSS